MADFGEQEQKLPHTYCNEPQLSSVTIPVCVRVCACVLKGEVQSNEAVPENLKDLGCLDR